MAPLLYIDTQAIYQKFAAMADDPDQLMDEIKFMRSIERIAVAIRVDDDYQTHLRLVAFLDQP
jgi:hypothetical protein